MLTTCEKKRVDNSNLVVSVVCHLVTSAVAPVLPVVPVVSVVVKTEARQIQTPDKQKQQILRYQREQAHSRREAEQRSDKDCRQMSFSTTAERWPKVQKKC